MARTTRVEIPRDTYGTLAATTHGRPLSQAVQWSTSSLTPPWSAFGCDFNRSMQHLISKYREEDVADEEISTHEVALYDHKWTLKNRLRLLHK